MLIRLVGASLVRWFTLYFFITGCFTVAAANLHFPLQLCIRNSVYRFRFKSVWTNSTDFMEENKDGPSL